MKYAHCLRIVFVSGKHTDIFQRADFMLGVGFHRENFPCGGKFPGVNFLGENLH